MSEPDDGDCTAGSPDWECKHECVSSAALAEHLEYCPNHALEKIRNHIEEMKKTAAYDWNADPLFITRIEGWLHEATEANRRKG